MPVAAPAADSQREVKLSVADRGVCPRGGCWSQMEHWGDLGLDVCPVCLYFEVPLGRNAITARNGAVSRKYGVNLKNPALRQLYPECWGAATRCPGTRMEYDDELGVYVCPRCSNFVPLHDVVQTAARGERLMRSA